MVDGATRILRPGRIRVLVERAAGMAREGIYEKTIARWGWWPAVAPGLRARASDSPAAAPKVGYYIWHFPVLSQTFVRREIEALRKQGLVVRVFTDAAEDVELLSERDRDLLKTTTYLLPIDRKLLARYKREFRRDRGFAYYNIYLYIMSRRYGLRKKLGRDRALFEQAVYLAGHMRNAGVDWAHSPWGDRAGFALMLAAMLLDIPFSLQVRAHDLHDPNYHHALREMLPRANFVITNTLYNRPFITDLMPAGATAIHTIYNGINLSEFNPPDRSLASRGPVRILCVARLIEQKGLTYLLDACALLRDRNFAFVCEIIGSPEEPLYTSYWKELQAQHHRLLLGETVIFTGAKSFAEVMDAYREANIFVLPCVVAKDGRRDVTPNAIIEAMAMKLPVISTPVAGVAEIIENGISGLLVEPENAPAVADEIERVGLDHALATKLGESARARIEERFDADRNVSKRLRLFGVEQESAPPQPSMQMSWQES
jgi:glycosyltransferase involved in cell wall biosynthesis